MGNLYLFNVHEHLFASLNELLFENGSTLKGKNLLLEEQILFFSELTSNEKGGKTNRNVSFASIPIHFNTVIRGIWQALSNYCF